MKSKEHKIVFNLSIKDLKELGILDKKKKKKKRRKSKYSKKKGLNNFGEGYRTENLSRGETITDATNHLKNQLVVQQLKAIQNGEEDKKVDESRVVDYHNPKLALIENQLNDEKIRNNFLHVENRNAMIHLYNELQSSRFNKPRASQPPIYDTSFSPQMTQQNYLHEDDNIDAASTGGSDSFQFGGNHPPTIEELPPSPIKEVLPLSTINEDDDENDKESAIKETNEAFQQILTEGLSKTKQRNLISKMEEYKNLLKVKNQIYDSSFEKVNDIKIFTKEIKRLQALDDYVNTKAKIETKSSSVSSVDDKDEDIKPHVVTKPYSSHKSAAKGAPIRKIPRSVAAGGGKTVIKDEKTKDSKSKKSGGI
jgi:hypothetical protein